MEKSISKIEYLKSNISLTQKIVLAGLFIALTAILQKVTAINYIPIMPFLRISIGGPAMIIFSSIFLGPWWGMLVGAASDILGYFVFDPRSYAFFPQITLIYALLGFISYYVFSFIRYVRNEKLLFILESAVFIAFIAFISLYIGFNDELVLYSSTYEITPIIKIMTPIILSFLFILLFIFILLIRKKNNFVPFFNIGQISFALFIIEIAVMIIFGTIMKGLAFGFSTYLMILISQICVLFVNVPLNTLLIAIFLRVTKRKMEVR